MPKSKPPTKRASRGKSNGQSRAQRRGITAPPGDILIHGPHGYTSEIARAQAAQNIKADPALRAKMIKMLGLEEARRRYPEAGWEEA